MPHRARLHQQYALHRALRGALLAVGGILSIEMIALAWLTISLQETRVAQESASERLSLTSDVVYFDEVLTMSTWVFATSGDTHWMGRYEQAERELTQRLERLMALTPLHDREGQAARETAAANEALVTLERRARELTRSGALKEAQAVLTSSTYIQEKARYQTAILKGQREAARALDELRGVAGEGIEGALLGGAALLCLTCAALAWSLWARRRLLDELSALEGPLSQINDLEGRAREAAALASIRQRAVEEVTRELVEVEQHERRKLGQSLHDELQPLLAAARMQLSLAAPAGADVHLARADELLGEALEAARGVMLRLMPPHLDEGDLKRALEWLAGWLRVHQDFELEVSLSGPLRSLGRADQVLCFHATRECALNTLKHAGVRSARVRVEVGDQGALMRFEDSGRGLTLSAQQSLDPSSFTASYGLRHLSERARALGGELRTRGGAQGGFIVSLLLPAREHRPVWRAPWVEAAPDGGSAWLGTHPSPPLLGAPEGDARRPPPDLRGVRALIVDDNERLRGEVREVLTHFGCEWVEEAGSGVEAVALDRALEPSVVLMDISLPRLDGIEATRRICAARPRARVVMFSTRCAQEKRAEAVAAGACAYLEKGVSALTLAEVVRAAALMEVM